MQPKSIMVRRLLLVEDEAPVQELLGEYLRGRGFAVQVASDAATGRAALAAGGVDLLITDLKLPDGEGIELVRLAAAASPPVPSLVMSGFATVEVAVEALTTGAVDLLLKPFRLRAAHAIIERALARIARRAAETRRMALADWYEAVASAESVADVERCAAALVALSGGSGPGSGRGGADEDPALRIARRALTQATLRCGG